MHRNKLATALANKLARISWSVLHNQRALRHPLSGAAGDLIRSPHEFATEQRLERIDRLTLNLVAH